MIAVEFAPGSPEAQAALRCDIDRVVIPGYGLVDHAADEIRIGRNTYTHVVTAYVDDENR